MRKLLFLIVFTILSTLSYSQMIWGKVYDNEDNKLDSIVTVTLGNESIRTDEKGGFTILSTPDTKTISFTAIGFKPVEQQLKIEAGYDYMLRVCLVPGKGDKKKESTIFVTVKKQ